MSVEIKCPRCGSTKIKQIGDKSSSTLEFECLSKCSENTCFYVDSCEQFLHVYFQYDKDNHTYTWPVQVLYSLHEDELEAWHKGQIQPKII